VPSQPGWLPHFRESMLEERGFLDPARLEAEVVEEGLKARADAPDLGAYLLECADLPPYGAALQQAAGLPVFDWIGFVDWVHHAVVRTPYEGFIWTTLRTQELHRCCRI
jgi:hypothetical protein